jgi:TolB protein
MKKLNFMSCILLILSMCQTFLYSQDVYPVKQITSDTVRIGFPSWSPDGKYILYQYTDLMERAGKNGLWKMEPDGERAIQIYSGLAEHARWSPDGRFIVFDADTGKNIKMMPVGGKNPIKFLPDTTRINNGGLPCWSPDGSQIAFKDSSYSLWTYNLKTGKATRIFKREGLAVIPGCWTEDGKEIIIALMERQTRKSTIWKISSDGKENQQIKEHHDGFYRYLALSPDGNLLVYAAIEENRLGLWVMPAAGGKSLPLSITEKGHNESPAWSPDGKRLVFTSSRSGRGNIYIMELEIDKVISELKLLNK